MIRVLRRRKLETTSKSTASSGGSGHDETQEWRLKKRRVRFKSDGVIAYATIGATTYAAICAASERRFQYFPLSASKKRTWEFVGPDSEGRRNSTRNGSPLIEKRIWKSSKHCCVETHMNASNRDDENRCSMITIRIVNQEYI